MTKNKIRGRLLNVCEDQFAAGVDAACGLRRSTAFALE